MQLGRVELGRALIWALHVNSVKVNDGIRAVRNLSGQEWKVWVDAHERARDLG